MFRQLVLSMTLVGAAFVGGCSGDDDGGSSGGSAPATGCAADTRKDIYTAGLSKQAGSLVVKLIESKPGPPIKGTNALTLEVLDAAGAPLDGASVTVTPWMPDHAHGSAAKIVVTPLGGGRYQVDNVYLAMAGLWQIKIGVQPPGGGALQETMFQFCLDG
jgi:YtkA-like